MKNRKLKGKLNLKKQIIKKYSDKNNICKNSKCKLRKAGCRGFEGCPGFMTE